MRSLSERFWSKVTESESGCWVWTAATDKVSGYGRFQVEKKCKYAHRVSYELMVCEIPDGLTIDHLCRNRACVNPWHLEPVPHGVNTLRGDSIAAANAAKTHCPKSHLYDDANTARDSAGRRICRTCRDARNRAWYQENRDIALAYGKAMRARAKSKQVA